MVSDNFTERYSSLILIASVTLMASSCSSDARFSSISGDPFANSTPRANDESALSEDQNVTFENPASILEPDPEQDQSQGVPPTNVAGASLWGAHCMSVQRKLYQGTGGHSGNANAAQDSEFVTACSVSDTLGGFIDISGADLGANFDSILKSTGDVSESKTKLHRYFEESATEKKSLVFFKTDQFIEGLGLALPRANQNSSFDFIDVKVLNIENISDDTILSGTTILSKDREQLPELRLKEFLTRFVTSPIDPEKVTSSITIEITDSPDYFKILQDKVNQKFSDLSDSSAPSPAPTLAPTPSPAPTPTPTPAPTPTPTPAPTPTPTPAPTPTPTPAPTPTPTPTLATTEAICSKIQSQKTLPPAQFNRNENQCDYNHSLDYQNRYASFHIQEARISLNLPPESTVCEIVVRSQQPTFTHSDIFFLTLNNFIVATNQLPESLRNSTTSILQMPSKTSLNGIDFPSQNPRAPYNYCAPGANSCTLPPPGGGASDTVSAQGINVSASFKWNSQIFQPNAKAVVLTLNVIGDDDPEDCKHHGLKYEVDIHYVTK